MTSHARSNEARRLQSESGVSYAAALRHIRDQSPPAIGATRAAGAPVWDGASVPRPLLTATADHCRRARKHLNEAVLLGGRYQDNLREWRRLALYAITDAHAHTQLLAGTIAAFLQREGVEADLIRRFLQSPDADRYVTADASAHLAGLFGQPLPPGTDFTAWYDIGQHMAAQEAPLAAD
ncbi:hypothetical protein AB0I99_27295 [Streptomyces spongiicola]|uniref:hypothetical protein n=1 Tax=Streptomyces spongiicola TaxID=1690221 RepID=UPI0033F512C9